MKATTGLQEARSRSGQSNARAWRVLRIAVSVGLLAYLLAAIDIGAAIAIVARIRLDLLLALLALVAIDRILSAWRWYILLHRRDSHISFMRVLRLVLVSTFAGYAFPGSIGVEIVRIYGVTRSTSDLGRAVSSVLVERILAVLALLLLVALGLAFSSGLLPPAVGWLAWLAFAALLFGVLLIMLPAMRRLTLAMLVGEWLAPLRAKLQEIYTALDGYRQQPGLMVISVAVAVLFQLVRVAMAVVCAWALGGDAPLAYFLVIVPAVGLLTTLPISIGGLGIQDVSFVYLFGIVGMPAEIALPMSLLLHILVLVPLIVGAWLYWRHGLNL